MNILTIPCPGCRRPLTQAGCSNPECHFHHSGYTLPPPPQLTEAPDPFPELCPTCGQPAKLGREG
jgi:hypothetical protein